MEYRIYPNKRRGAYLIFRATSAALIRGRRLFKHCTRQIYFFYIFIQRYTFYLLIFLWADTKLIVNLELREKFTWWEKAESFMITRAKISAVRANSFVVVKNLQRSVNFDVTVSFFIRIYGLQRGRVSLFHIWSRKQAVCASNRKTKESSWACCAGKVHGPDIRASHSKNSGKRPYRPSREIQSLWTKEHHI